MIYTVTFNPCLDYVVNVDTLTLGAVNRASRETVMAGGKGVNVSIVLKNLGHASCAWGLFGRLHGRRDRTPPARYGHRHRFHLRARRHEPHQR